MRRVTFDKIDSVGVQSRPGVPMRTSLLLLSMLAVFVSRAQAAQQPNYEIIARLAQAPGNVTVTGSGKIIMSQHQFYEPNYSVVEHRDDGSLAPFPNKELNDRLSDSELKLDSVLGVQERRQRRCLDAR